MTPSVRSSVDYCKRSKALVGSSEPPYDRRPLKRPCPGNRMGGSLRALLARIGYRQQPRPPTAQQSRTMAVCQAAAQEATFIQREKSTAQPLFGFVCVRASEAAPADDADPQRG